MKLLAEVSAGELIDKITILELKLENINDAVKRSAIERELSLLEAVRDAQISRSTELQVLTSHLKQINGTLWRLEDNIRAQERANTFGDTFVELARSIYRTNDERSAVKNKINALLNSTLNEVKSYQEY